MVYLIFMVNNQSRDSNNCARNPFLFVHDDTGDELYVSVGENLKKIKSVPHVPWGLTGCPFLFEIILIPEGIHRVPEIVMLERIQLAGFCEIVPAVPAQGLLYRLLSNQIIQVRKQKIRR